MFPWQARFKPTWKCQGASAVRYAHRLPLPASLRLLRLPRLLHSAESVELAAIPGCDIQPSLHKAVARLMPGTRSNSVNVCACEYLYMRTMYEVWGIRMLSTYDLHEQHYTEWSISKTSRIQDALKIQPFLSFCSSSPPTKKTPSQSNPAFLCTQSGVQPPHRLQRPARLALTGPDASNSACRCI